jgi:hypothetical protein
MRFTAPTDGSPFVCVIDAGFAAEGEALVHQVKRYYGTDVVDLAILTHPTATTLAAWERCSAVTTCARCGCTTWPLTGGPPAGSQGVGQSGRGGASAGHRRHAGLCRRQRLRRRLGHARPGTDLLLPVGVRAAAAASRVREAARAVRERGQQVLDRAAGHLGIEVTFDEKSVTPRNNSSAVVSCRSMTRTCCSPVMPVCWRCIRPNGSSRMPIRQRPAVTRLVTGRRKPMGCSPQVGLGANQPRRSRIARPNGCQGARDSGAGARRQGVRRM